jgi:outer membrane protein assembly factor BamB
MGLALSLSMSAHAADWTHWRGLQLDGTSPETDLPTVFDPSDALWTLDVSARGTPVVHGDRVYLWGYRGTGDELAEVLVAMNADTGEVLWERVFRDFISDIIYDRYSIGSPTVDPETGNIYLLTSAGLFTGLTAEGEELWQVSMMDGWGRLTFPNGRTGAPFIDGDVVIVHNITANWGRQGPARDRFNAFDKLTGEPVWVSTPGTAPKDSSHSSPVLDVLEDGRHVLYAGTGCGNVVAVDTRTGDPVWRIRLSAGGVNTSPILVGDRLVVSHAKENLDTTTMGRTVGIDVNAPTVVPEGGGTPILQGEAWRNNLADFSSSPVVADGVVYLVTMTGELTAVDLDDGTILWAIKLAPDQLHAAPAWADGHLYVPMRDGSLHVIKASREGGEIVHTAKLEGTPLGAPAIAHGRVYVATTAKLYVFGEVKPGETPVTAETPTPLGPPVRLRVRPAEVLLRPGDAITLTADVLDALGQVIERVPVTAAERWIPPTAKVKAEMDATFVDGALVAAEDASLSAGAWKVQAAGLEGTVRGRVVVGVPFTEDFDAVELNATDTSDTAFSYPPLPWIGARFKWDVRERDGSPVFAKTLDRLLFQRSTVFIGHPDEAGYTLQADVMTDGDRRQLGAIGVVNQRYRFTLKANQRRLEISSNQERLKEGVPFTAVAGVWYTLKSEVRMAEDGSATVRAKVWPRDEAEPDAWTLEITDKNAHTHGAPGLFGFSPQNRHKVYIDNIALTPTEEVSP